MANGVVWMTNDYYGTDRKCRNISAWCISIKDDRETIDKRPFSKNEQARRIIFLNLVVQFEVTVTDLLP